MLKLRPILFLALGLSLNATIASERLEDSTMTSYANGNSPLLLAERPGSRRRGIGCDTSPDLWSFNIFCKTRSFCYVDQNDVKLWRPKNPTKPLGRVDVVIKNRVTQQKVELPWLAQESYLTWPVEQMPIESGRIYMLTLKQGVGKFHPPQPRVLYQIPTDLQTPAEKAQWMEEKGCDEQADMLKKSDKQAVMLLDKPKV